MSLQVKIHLNNEPIYTFKSIGEVQTLINLLTHAKVGEGMRWEFMLSDTATDLISVLSEVMKTAYSDHPSLSALFKGASASTIDDNGELERKVTEIVVAAFPDKTDEELKQLVSKGMYPWKP